MGEKLQVEMSRFLSLYLTSKAKNILIICQAEEPIKILINSLTRRIILTRLLIGQVIKRLKHRLMLFLHLCIAINLTSLRMPADVPTKHCTNQRHSMESDSPCSQRNCPSFLRSLFGRPHMSSSNQITGFHILESGEMASRMVCLLLLIIYVGRKNIKSRQYLMRIWS